MAEESTLGILSFLSFAFSIIAAVLAIDMYTLLRTGQFGSSWRVMIIASVIFVLVQVLRLAEVLHWEAFQVYALTQIVELVFVMALAYAFFLQRKAFTRVHKQRQLVEETEDAEEVPADEDGADWDEFTSRYFDEKSVADEGEAVVHSPVKVTPSAPSSGRR